MMKDGKNNLRGVVGGFTLAMLTIISPTAVQFAAGWADQIAGADSGVTTISPTTTSPIPSSTPPTPFAKPEISGPAKLPPEEQGLPGD